MTPNIDARHGTKILQVWLCRSSAKCAHTSRYIKAAIITYFMPFSPHLRLVSQRHDSPSNIKNTKPMEDVFVSSPFPAAETAAERLQAESQVAPPSTPLRSPPPRSAPAPTFLYRQSRQQDTIIVKTKPHPQLRETFISSAQSISVGGTKAVVVLNDDCPICYSPLFTTTNHDIGHNVSIGIVWVSISQHVSCRKVFHADCLKIWDQAQIGEGRATTCPNCRGIMRERVARGRSIVTWYHSLPVRPPAEPLPPLGRPESRSPAPTSNGFLPVRPPGEPLPLPLPERPESRPSVPISFDPFDDLMPVRRAEEPFPPILHIRPVESRSSNPATFLHEPRNRRQLLQPPALRLVETDINTNSVPDVATLRRLRRERLFQQCLGQLRGAIAADVDVAELAYLADTDQADEISNLVESAIGMWLARPHREAATTGWLLERRDFINALEGMRDGRGVLA